MCVCVCVCVCVCSLSIYFSLPISNSPPLTSLSLSSSFSSSSFLSHYQFVYLSPFLSTSLTVYLSHASLNILKTNLTQILE